MLFYLRETRERVEANSDSLLNELVYLKRIHNGE